MATTNDILGTTADISKVLADYERARAQGDVATAGVNQNQANTANNLYRTQAQFALDGPSISAAQAAKGDVQANIQPFAWTGDTKMVGKIPVPQSTGGLNPGLFGPNARQAGQKLATLGNSRVLSPNFNLPSAPSLAPVPEASGLDKTLSTAGLIGNVLGAGSKFFNKGQTGPTPADPSGGAGKPSGSGASFPLPFSGFQWPGSQGPAGVPNGSSDGFDASYNREQNSTQGLDPSQPVGGQVDDPVQQYLLWLASQPGGSDASQDPSDWGNP